MNLIWFVGERKRRKGEEKVFGEINDDTVVKNGLKKSLG